ncbi:MAG: hypothetical protein IJZ88_05310 [Clostridia bacterium]|nr:hypothetical protein [Clostridia bacterium]
MELNALIPLVFAVLFLLADTFIIVKMLSVLKKSRNETVENFGNKIKPYLYATGVVSMLMAVCVIVLAVIK